MALLRRKEEKKMMVVWQTPGDSENIRDGGGVLELCSSFSYRNCDNVIFMPNFAVTILRPAATNSKATYSRSLS
jgi:hypothetical protein